MEKFRQVEAVVKKSLEKFMRKRRASWKEYRDVSDEEMKRLKMQVSDQTG